MVKISKLFIVLFLVQSSLLYSCPTCVATVTNNPAPFFTDEFYEPHQEEFLELDTILTGSNF